ncbi:hypothetical protein V7201_10765 [Bacillus sp. JJ1122]|uniref:hypothetical protein n=1 Tax=Bacillus sp. JJ1122 TaxID=3122951 RepID=UPI003000809C
MVKLVTFVKNNNQRELDVSAKSQVEKIMADGWKPVPECIMKNGEQVVIAKNEVQQSAFESMGFVKVGEQDPLV